MGIDTKIQWASHTFNCWRGCTKVSPGCANCYAESFSKQNPRVLGKWGPQGTRVVASEAMWAEPLHWDRQAALAGERRRVFCASLADVFEGWPGQMSDHGERKLWTGPLFNPGGKAHTHWWTCSTKTPSKPVDQCHVLFRLFNLIRQTPALDWLLLTKRPEHFQHALAAVSRCVYGGEVDETIAWIVEWQLGRPPANVWLGVSVEDQEWADKRIPLLLRFPARVRFLSVEPLLGPVDLKPRPPHLRGTCLLDHRHDGTQGDCQTRGLDWVIVGGESGSKARECQIPWIRDIVRECQFADTPVFVKQLGAKATVEESTDPDQQWFVPEERRLVPLRLADRKGGDLEEFPEDLRIREVPDVTCA